MLADELEKLQPGLRVLYMSGYDETQVVRRYVIEKGHALVRKPFTPEELVRKVEEMLARPA